MAYDDKDSLLHEHHLAQMKILADEKNARDQALVLEYQSQHAATQGMSTTCAFEMVSICILTRLYAVLLLLIDCAYSVSIRMYIHMCVLHIQEIKSLTIVC